MVNRKSLREFYLSNGLIWLFKNFGILSRIFTFEKSETIITVRKRSCGKVMLLHLSVSHSVHGGVSASVHAGIHPPGQTPLWTDNRPCRRLLQRTVRILVDCILVPTINCNCWKVMFSEASVILSTEGRETPGRYMGPDRK